ncbi:MAG: trypsin-like peptidase domain-containing protein [Actinobacteria bacterium]|nr:trypsin-like peptidase domain-containing protein [Actinomycetota bacterium]
MSVEVPSVTDDDPVRRPFPQPEQPPRRKRRGRILGLIVLALVLAAALAAAGLAYFDVREQASDERAERRAAVSELDGELRRVRSRLSSLSAQNDGLLARLEAAERSLRQERAGLAPLARRVQRSVFTIRVFDGEGSGWAAYTEDGSTYVVTAEHVVEGSTAVDVRQRDRSWDGEVVRIDEENDLALVRVDGLIAPALWQDPENRGHPRAGDELLLVGSPYGLEGSVTTGVVSRASDEEIQTDAAANPGNSGGPLVDGRGRVAGVLVSGAGENVNFAVPLQRACIVIRDC